MKPREQQVLELISRGYTTTEISQHLYLSAETIKTYRSQLMVKMKAKNAANLICKAMRGGYLGFYNVEKISV